MGGDVRREPPGTWYDRVDLYDVLFGWDPAVEREFVLGAAARWGLEAGAPRRILEPFCGSGRLLRAMPAAAYVAGFDRNPRMLRVAARRAPLARIFRADAARFSVQPSTFDLAYCLIDSIRHLLRDADVMGHLRCMARALRPGGVYVLGLDVTGDLPFGDASAEDWTEEREGVRVSGLVRSLGDADPVTRVETVHARMHRHADADGAGAETIEDFFPMRVYGRDDLRALVAREGSFELAAVHDRHYDLERTIDLDAAAGGVVLILVRREKVPAGAP